MVDVSARRNGYDPGVYSLIPGGGPALMNWFESACLFANLPGFHRVKVKLCLIFGFLIPGISVILSQEITVVKINSGFIVDIHTPIPEFRKVGLHDSIPLLSEAKFIYEKGAPEIPKITRSFPLNSLDRFFIEIIEDEVLDVPASIAPSAGFVYQDQRDLGRVKGKEYSMDAFFPERVVRDFEPVNSHGEYLQNCWFYPLQYNPVMRMLRIHSYLKIKLTDRSTACFKPERTSSGEPLLPSMLIVAPDDFIDALSAFMQWKKQMGINVRLCSFSGYKSSAQIKNMVQSEYNRKKFDYLLLAGDDQIPPFASVYGPGDYPYGLLEGTDSYVDVGIGRFPAANKNELHNIIKKSIEYEKAQPLGKWITTFCGIASANDGNHSGDNGESDAEHINNLAQLYHSNGFVSNIILEKDAGLKSVSVAINNGCDYIFYTGHGDGTSWISVHFTVDSAKHLKNYKKHPLIFDASCLNGDFSGKTCLAEQFIKDSMGSAVCMASTISQLWAPPMLGQDRIAGQLFAAPDSTKPKILGDLCRQTFYDMIAEYEAGGEETAYTWVLFGDPSLALWYKMPDTISVTAPDAVNVSQDTVKVEAETGTFVTLVLDSVLLDYATVTDKTANLLHNSAHDIDSLLLTFTKNQHVPYIKSLKPYNDAGSYYSIKGYKIYDDNNNIPENNEWIYVSLNIANLGIKAGRNVTIKMFSSDSSLIIGNNSVVIDSVSGNSMIRAEGFHVRTKSVVADSFVTSLHVSITDNSGQTNTRRLSLVVYSPEVHLSKMTIQDKGDTIPELIQRDTAEVSIIIRNSGHAPSTDTRCHFELTDMFIEMIDNRYVSLNIPAFSEDTVRFRFRILDNCYKGHCFTGNVFLEDQDNQSLTFSYFYKARPDLIIDTRRFTVSDFPFYNYYLSSRTQILYNGKEFLNHSMIIDSIGLNVASYTSYPLARILKNFKIKLLEYDSTSFNFSFVDTKSIVPVFSEDQFIMPGRMGWVFFNINDLFYSGMKPLLLELSWGINPVPSSYLDIFTVYASETENNCVAYGYNDFKEMPDFMNCSKFRPDIYFAGKTEDLYRIKLTINDAVYSPDMDTLFIKIGEKFMALARYDSLQVDLPASEFYYTLFSKKEGFELLSDRFIVLPTTRYIELGGNGQPLRVPENSSGITCFLSQGKLKIELPDKCNRVSFTLIDLNGRVIYKERINSSSYCKALPVLPGIYLIYIITDEDEVIYQDKIVNIK
jgi:hypothetical protein